MVAKPKAKSATVAAFLEALPPDRRATLTAVRTVIREHLPDGYEESVGWGGGVIAYSVPLEELPDTYNGHPLTYAALASQKNYCTLHLMMAYADPARQAWLQEQFEKRGKKFDMGKACLRFKTADDLPLDVIGETIASVPKAEYIRRYAASRKK